MANPASTINVHAQAGFEGSPGAGGAATYQLVASVIEPKRELAVAQYAPQGYRFDTIAAINQEWSSLALSGPGLYTEFGLMLENAFGTVSPTTPAGATRARKRVYTPPITGLITPRTWALQWGDPSDNVNAVNYGLLTGIGLKGDREKGVELNGCTGIGQKIQTGSAFTASPTALANTPILGSHLNYYIDASGAALGTTQILDEVLDHAWKMDGFKGPRWVSDRAQGSYKGHVDLKPTAEIELSVAESSVTRGLIAGLLIGSVYFLRINAQGQYVDNGYTLTISGAPTGGTFTISYKGQTTTGIAFSAASSAVQSALTALTTVGTGNATVSGSAGGPYTILFVGALGQDPTAPTTSGAGLTGGTSPASAIVAAPFYEMLNVDIAFRILTNDKLGDGSGASKGVYMSKLTGVIVADSTWGNALQITHQSEVAAY